MKQSMGQKIGSQHGTDILELAEDWYKARKDEVKAYNIQVYSQWKININNNTVNLLENDTEMENLFCSDDAHFHIVCAVIKQNFCYFAVESPRESHQQPLHCPRLIAWRVLSLTCVTGTYFFDDLDTNTVTVNAEHYTDTINNFFATGINAVPGRENLWFHQVESAAHTQRVSMAVVCNVC